MLMPGPGRRVPADHESPPAYGGAAPVAGVSADLDGACGHGLPQAPSGAAQDLHVGSVHEAAAVVAHAAFEGDGDGGENSHGQVVLGLGLPDADPGLSRPDQVLDLLVDLPGTPVAGLDLGPHHTVSAAGSGRVQMRTRLTPGSRASKSPVSVDRRAISSVAMATQSSDSATSRGLNPNRSLA